MAAFLLCRPGNRETEAQKRLHDMGVNLREVQEAFRNHLRRYAGDDDQSVWTEILAVAPDVSPPAPIEVAVRALSDRSSTKADKLGFTDYADALADFIRNEGTEKPLTIGIDGAWGTGKTVLMEMIRDRLRGRGENGQDERAIRTVWFNAWKYDEVEALWAALALEILSQVRKQCTFSQQIRLWATLNLKRISLGPLVSALGRAMLYPAGLVLVCCVEIWAVRRWIRPQFELLNWAKFVAAGGLLGALFTITKELRDEVIAPFDLGISKYLRRPDYKARMGFLGEFEADFRLVIDAATQGGKWPLTIFIDDLDRCEPPKPVEIIEAINLLLDAQHCVFVIGMDSRTVAASIETKYKGLTEDSSGSDGSGGLTLGQRFIEKIIQIHFYIPKSSPELLASFADANLTKQGQAPRELPVQNIVEAEKLIEAEQRAGRSVQEAAEVVQSARPDIPKGAVEEARQNVYAKSFDDDPAARTAIHAMIPFLESNPRKIKRFINVFRLQALIANRRGLFESGAISPNFLAVWSTVAMCWPEIPQCVSDRWFIERLREARALYERSFKTGEQT